MVWYNLWKVVIKPQTMPQKTILTLDLWNGRYLKHLRHRIYESINICRVSSFIFIICGYISNILDLCWNLSNTPMWRLLQSTVQHKRLQSKSWRFFSHQGRRVPICTWLKTCKLYNMKCGHCFVGVCLVWVVLKVVVGKPDDKIISTYIYITNTPFITQDH